MVQVENGRVHQPLLEILYRDERLLAVYKPAGLLVHRSAIDRHETRFLLQLLRDQIGRRVYPAHRLDKPTAGIMLFALDPELAGRLTEAFTENRVRKTYLAVVRGWMEGRGRIDYALREELDPMTDRQARPDKPPQPAVTDWCSLGRVELPHPVGRYPSARYSLLELRPQSGRKHQLRRHLKHVFHPVVGDTTHGDGRHNRFFRSRLNCHRLLLAALRLELEHPLTGQNLDLRARPDPEFLRVLGALGWRGPENWRDSGARD